MTPQKRKKNYQSPINLRTLLSLPIGKERILVWIRWAFSEESKAYHLCKETDGTIFVVPVIPEPHIPSSEEVLLGMPMRPCYEIHNFGTQECHDRIYLERP